MNKMIILEYEFKVKLKYVYDEKLNSFSFRLNC
jgi:hypothetical protein